MGRYILPSVIFDLLEDQEAGKNGEIQLTDALSVLARRSPILAYNFEGLRHDVGEKMGFIQTSIHYAQREELREDLLAYMSKVMEKVR